MSVSRVLVVEDDPRLAATLERVLAAEKYEVEVAGDGHDALRRARERTFDLVVLDIMLPGLDGIAVCTRLRASGAIPILLLTALGGTEERVRGLDSGADDYVVKPFSYTEVRARIEAMLRRANLRPGQGKLRVGELQIDPPSRDVRLRGRRIVLSQKEFALLRTLATEPTRVFTKEELLRNVWGFRALGSTRTLDSHACRLRQKLGRGGDRFVLNVWGVGYRLIDGPVDA